MGRQKGLHFYNKKKKISSAAVRTLFSWLLSIAIVTFVALILTYFFGMTSVVVGTSMEPELYSEQKILIDRFTLTFASPKQGDIILFLPNGNSNSHYYTKRVIGVPGDVLLIEDGILYINGVECELFDDLIVEAGIAGNELTVPAGEYFVMGDNPEASEDSRSANIGTISKENIIGKVWYRFSKDDHAAGVVKHLKTKEN